VPEAEQTDHWTFG